MSKRKHSFKNLAILSLAGSLFIGGTLFLWAASIKVPDLASLEKRKVEQSTKIFDRTGDILLFDLHENVKRTLVPLSEISPYVQNATVAIEDAEFYSHKGIKPTAILRAIIANLTSLGFEQGGSTITQQVVKNSILVQDKTISRKLKEWILSLKLERVATKEQILELYLNETPYGGTMYGIEEASEAYFGKHAKDVTLAEAAYLAALPQAPTFFSPYGSNTKRLTERKDLVLSRMLSNNFITQEEYDLAKIENVEFKPQQDTGIKAPHFVFYVKEYLESKYGKKAVEEQGFRVITTLDYTLQKKAEEIVKRNALENAENFNATNAALIAIDPRTGEILSMVGSRDYFDPEIDGNFNASIASNRQPGSAFKPFVYAEAFKKGYTPDTVVFNLKTQFSTACREDNFTSDGNCYSPTNYDGKFTGPMTLREALAQSVNIPAIKIFYLAGLQDSLRLAKDMGITGLTNIAQYGLTLVLGGGEVSLIDITSAYGVFANDGIRNPYASILRIEDASGNVLEEFSPRPIKVLDGNIARTVSDVLSDNEARAPAFGDRSALYFPNQDVAVKTGTTNEYRDAWIVGYTPNIAVGTWAGNNDNTPMEKKVAGFIVAPMWNEFMQAALALRDKESFKLPSPQEKEAEAPIIRGLWQGGESYTIDTISKKRATQYTPQETREERVVQNVHSILYWVDKNDPTGPSPKNPAKDPQFRLWEYPVQLWKAREGIVDGSVNEIPTEVDDVHTPKNMPSVTIKTPQTGSSLEGNTRTDVVITTSGTYSTVSAEYFINGVFVGSSKRSPFSFSFVPNTIPEIKTTNTLTVVVKDSVSNRTEASIPFSVN